MQSVTRDVVRMFSDTTRVLILGGVLAIVVGCSTDRASAPKPPDTGSLTVTITAPSGALPNVTVAGPGFTVNLYQTGTVPGLSPGNYTVTAGPAFNNNYIATTDYLGTVTGSTTVNAGQADTVAVNYTAVPGSGALWVVNLPGAGAPNTILSYASSQLLSSATVSPTTVLTTQTATVRNAGIAIDYSGNLWVSDGDANTVSEYLAAQLATSANPTPAVTISSNAGSLNGPAGLAFDWAGNLWVANSGNNTLVRYTVTQLQGAVSPVPFVTLIDTLPNSLAGWGLAFDQFNNLWVTNPTLSTVVEFSAGQLSASSRTAPTVTLAANAGSLNGPLGLAFDASGNLWVVNSGSGTVAEFTELTSSGSPVPAVTLSAAPGGLEGPTAITFDSQGDLWVSNTGGGGSVEEFAAASGLGQSGPRAANVILSGSGGIAPIGLAFDQENVIQPLYSPYDYGRMKPRIASKH